MRTFLTTISALLLGALTSSTAQVRHASTITVRVDGDCPMCEKTIEKAAFVKGEASADWDVDAKTATITIDSTRTTVDAVLRRIAEAGYDNERYLAPDAAYSALPGCCQYERSRKQAPVAAAEVHEHIGHHHPAEQVTAQAATDPLAPVFEAYFKLKDALVASNTSDAQVQASALNAAIKAVDMAKLDHAVHAVWMQVMEPLANVSSSMAANKGLEKQRKAFVELTAPLAQLAKVAPQPTPIYLDHCPMYIGGADWLSREKAIKNPYYGSSMLSCGSVKETIGK